MVALVQYRKFITAILLAIYVFISTPIQLWHHHNITVTKKHTTDTQDITVSQNADNHSETDCPICNHTYSTYNDDIFFTRIISIDELSFKNGHYTTSSFSSPSLSLQNKGPPALG